MSDKVWEAACADSVGELKQELEVWKAGAADSAAFIRAQQRIIDDQWREIIELRERYRALASSKSAAGTLPTG